MTDITENWLQYFKPELVLYDNGNQRIVIDIDDY